MKHPLRPVFNSAIPANRRKEEVEVAELVEQLPRAHVQYQSLMESLVASIASFLAPSRSALLLPEVQEGQNPMAVVGAGTTTGLPLPHGSSRATQAAVTVRALLRGMG